MRPAITFLNIQLSNSRLYRKSFLGSNGSLECIRDRRNADGNRRHINMEKTENVEKCKKSVNVSIDNLQINDILPSLTVGK